MRPFTIGEEVIYDGERYVITTIRPEDPYEFCLIRTGMDGAEIVWANSPQLQRMEQYLMEQDDTLRV